MEIQCPYCAGEVKVNLQPAMTNEEWAVFQAIGEYAWGFLPSKGYIRLSETPYHYKFRLQRGDTWISGTARWFPGPFGSFEIVEMKRSEE